MSDNSIHVPGFLVSMWDHRYWWMSVFGGVVGAVWWWLTRTFPTHNDMMSCRSSIAADFKEQMDKHEKRERVRFDTYKVHDSKLHEKLGDDIEYIRDRVDRVVDHLLKGK